VTALIDTLRAIVRDELARSRAPELGVVTAVHPRDAEGSDANHQAHVRLVATGVELQHVPVVVGRLGVSVLPQVGDTVLVLFVQGDLNAPVVVGSLYDAAVQPPVAQAGEWVYQPSDAGGDASLRRLHIALGDGATLTFDDENLTVKLGGTELTIAKDGDVTVTSAAKLVVKTQGDMSFEASGNLDLKAQGNVTVSGVAATVEGTGSAKLKAPAVSLAGNTQFSPS
jgi:phage baseplate assembly protein gpV